MPLTTDKWKTRWSEMCLLPIERSDQDKESAAKAAEAWRLNPAFQRDEVTMTRIGASGGILVSLMLTNRSKMKLKTP
jgi:protein arginine N-methyltransferase 5